MNQVINLNIDSEQEEAQIDLTLEPQISKEKAAPKATLATMAADSLKDYDPYPRTTEDKFQNYLDIYYYVLLFGCMGITSISYYLEETK